MEENTDTGQEPKENPVNKILEKQSEEIISSVETDMINTNQKSENGDTRAHHQHHTSGKKFRHYFFEFFYAVSCGVLRFFNRKLTRK